MLSKALYHTCACMHSPNMQDGLYTFNQPKKVMFELTCRHPATMAKRNTRGMCSVVDHVAGPERLEYINTDELHVEQKSRMHPPRCDQTPCGFSFQIAYFNDVVPTFLVYIKCA